MFLIFFPKVDFGDATLTIASVGFGLLLILLLVTGVWAVHKWKVLMIEMMMVIQLVIEHNQSNQCTLRLQILRFKKILRKAAGNLWRTLSFAE